MKLIIVDDGIEKSSLKILAEKFLVKESERKFLPEEANEKIKEENPDFVYTIFGNPVSGDSMMTMLSLLGDKNRLRVSVFKLDFRNLFYELFHINSFSLLFKSSAGNK